MVMRVFVAGGTGVIGRRLVPQLVARGHQVTATTTGPAKLGSLEQLGADAVVMDGLDAVSVGKAVASLVGCSFCLDLGYFQAHNKGLDVTKAREVPRWRESDVFTPLERDVMEYAEAMTQTPPTVTDELSARLLEALGPAALVELTMFTALANLMTRSNTAIGIESQEFSAACDLKPLASPSSAVRSPA
jgi:alkylhydroperoxidase family enzyme